MTDLRQAAQQALEALESVNNESLWWGKKDAAITALRAALAEPEQPAAWIEGPYGEIRRNPLYRVVAPQSVAWSIPLYAGEQHGS